MKDTVAWDDYAYFAAVARHGGLARAADALGVSQATLSRRMRAVETQIGRRLFVHGQSGYALTPEGRELWRRTQAMEDAAAEIARWQHAAGGPVRVRISAGTWTSIYLAEGLADYWRPEATWLPEFLHCERMMDIARREVDIGVRNARPEQPWLAGRRIGHVEYAVFGLSQEVTGWIGLTSDAVQTPSARWVETHHGDAIASRANGPTLACALARAGIGRIVLPTFIGGRIAALARLGPPIADLRSEQWLVSHHEGRRDPPVRDALDAVAGYLAQTPG